MLGVQNVLEITSACTLRLDSTKQYADANPILKHIASKIFNHTFKSFYDFAMRVNSISSKLLEVTDTAYGDISQSNFTHVLKLRVI